MGRGTGRAAESARPCDVRGPGQPNARWDPALHPVIVLVSTAVEAVPAFDDADASLASGAPFLAVAEPAFLLLAFACGAFGRSIGDADALDAVERDELLPCEDRSVGDGRIARTTRNVRRQARAYRYPLRRGIVDHGAGTIQVH